MSAIQQLPKPEQLVDLVSHAAAVKLAMDGEFDGKIAELKAATQALADAQKIAKNVAESERIRSDADDYSTKARAAADAAVTKAQGMVDKIAAREAAVAAREGAVSSREATVDQRQAAQDSREQSLTAAQDAHEKRKAEWEESRKKIEEKLKAQTDKLGADIRAFNQRLDALKV